MLTSLGAYIMAAGQPRVVSSLLCVTVDGTGQPAAACNSTY